MGNTVQNTQTENWEDVEKRWTNAENTQRKEAVFQEILAKSEQLRHCITSATDDGVEEDETPSTMKLGTTQKGQGKEY